MIRIVLKFLKQKLKVSVVNPSVDICSNTQPRLWKCVSLSAGHFQSHKQTNISAGHEKGRQNVPVTGNSLQMNIQNICIHDTTLLNSAKTFGNFDLELTLPKAILPSIRSCTAHYIR